MLLVEQNAKMALDVGDYGYVMEIGRIVMEDSCERLKQATDIQEFYLGMKDQASRNWPTRSRCERRTSASGTNTPGATTAIWLVGRG